MIINLDGYGKRVLEKSSVKKTFKSWFSSSRYYYDDNTKCLDLTTPFDREDETYFEKDTRVGIITKTNHDDLPSLISTERDKKSLLLSTCGVGFHKLNNQELLYGDFSSMVYDIFMYLRGHFSKEYHIIIVKPNDSDKEIQLSDNTYWGVTAFDGNFLFSSNLRDNLPRSYKDKKTGYGIKFLIRDSRGNELEVGKVDEIYNIYNELEGLYFELDIDAITAARLNGSKTLYGSGIYTDEIRDFSLGDMYKEKMIDAIAGLIGIYASSNKIEDNNEPFANIYIDVIASICIIRDIDEDTLRNVIANILMGLHYENVDLLDFITNLILHQEEKIIDEAEKKNYYVSRAKKSLHEMAIVKEQQLLNKTGLVRRIKKPQE